MAKLPIEERTRLMTAACSLIAEGMTVKQAALKVGTTRATLWEWAREHPELGDQYARARSMSAEAYEDEALEVARASTNETAAADRILIDQLKWAAGKRRPDYYGDRKHVEVSGTVANLHISALRASAKMIDGNNLDVKQLASPVTDAIVDSVQDDDTEQTPNL